MLFQMNQRRCLKMRLKKDQNKDDLNYKKEKKIKIK